jgi:hypothetical protein
MLPKKCRVCKHKTLSFDQKYAFCTNCMIYRKRLNFIQRVLIWASGKQWWWRLPILLWFGFMLVQNWHDPSFALNRLSNPFSALDLGMHELGHFIFRPLGEFMYIAGGSFFQCLFPILWLIRFIQKRWYFAAAMCWCWLGLNLFDVATYAADARARLLPLATGFAGLFEQGSDAAYDRAHDWYQLLSRTNNLNADLAIANGLRIAGTVAFAIGLTIGTIMILQMFISTFRSSDK